MCYIISQAMGCWCETNDKEKTQAIADAEGAGCDATTLADNRKKLADVERGHAEEVDSLHRSMAEQRRRIVPLPRRRLRRLQLPSLARPHAHAPKAGAALAAAQQAGRRQALWNAGTATVIVPAPQHGRRRTPGPASTSHGETPRQAVPPVGADSGRKNRLLSRAGRGGAQG